jgi:hypothetical protein
MAEPSANPNLVVKAVAEQEKEARKDPFLGDVGPSDFLEREDTIIGSRKNLEFTSRFFGSDEPRVKRYAQAIERAIPAYQKYQKDKASWDSYVAKTRLGGLDGGGAPVDFAGQTPVITTEPQLNPYVSWLGSRGSSKEEILSTISREQDKADFMFKRMEEMGVIDLVKDNPDLINYPDRFADVLESKGFFNNKQEKEFFLKNTQSKYSNHYGTSVHDKIFMKSFADSDAMKYGPTTLTDKMNAGYRLNVLSPKDMALFNNASKYSKGTSGSEILSRASDAFGHLLGEVISTMPSMVRATAYPQWDWSEEFKNASGADLELKNEFIFNFNAMLDAHRKGLLASSDVDTQILRYAEKDNVDAAALEKAEWDILDPDGAGRPTDAQIQKTTALYKELVKKGAIKNDIRGLNAMMSTLDGIITATAGWTFLVGSTDPNSFWSNNFGRAIGTYYEWPVNGGPWSEAVTRGRMRWLNTMHDWQKTHSDWASQGMLFSKIARDTDVNKHTSAWMDVTVAYGLFKTGAMVLGGSLGSKTIGAVRGGASIATRTEAAAVAREIARKGATLPDEVQGVVTAVRDHANAAGELIDDYGAIERIFAGEASWYNPATKAVEKVSPQLIEGLRKSIIERANGVANVRKQLAGIIKEGRRINYTKEATDTIDLLRQRLAEIEPNIGWDKATNFEIYQRARMGELLPPGGKTAVEIPKSRLDNLFKEVGNTWRRFDKGELAGFEKFDKVEEWLGSRLAESRLRSGSRAARGAQGLFDKFSDRIKDLNPPTAAEIGNTIRIGSDSAHEASMNINYGGQSSAYKQWNEGRKILSLTNLFGYADYGLDFMADFQKAFRSARTETAITYKNMKAAYSTQLDGLVSQLERMNAGLGTTATKEEITALMGKIERITAKRNFAGLMESTTSFGFGSAFFTMANGVKSGFVNEGLLYLADTNMLGTATGYSLGFKGVNSFHRSFVRNFSPTYGVNERTTMDLMELSTRMAEMEPTQARNLQDIILSLAAKRDAEKASVRGIGVLKREALEFADNNFAHYVSLLNRLHSNYMNVEFHDAGVVTGAVSIFTSQEYASTPEVALEMKNYLLRLANERGLSGVEAEGFAGKILATHRDSNVAKARLSGISTEINSLTTERDKLIKQTNGDVANIIQASHILADDLGINIDKLEVAPDVLLLGAPEGVNAVGIGQAQKLFGTLKGKDVNFTRSLTPEVLKRIDAFKASYIQAANKRIVNNDVVVKLNDKIAGLQFEAENMQRFADAVPAFRPGEVFSLEDGTQITRKRGVTLFETPTKDEHGGFYMKTQVLIDKNYFLEKANFKTGEPGGLAVGFEELSHVLFMSQNMQTKRVQFIRNILGTYELNEHNEWVQREKPEITGDAEQNLALMDKFVRHYAEGLDEGSAAAYVARWEHGKKMWRKNKGDLRYMNDSFMELFGQVHVQRLMMNNPQGVRSGSTGSTIAGGIETSAIIAGNPRWKNFFKFALGQVTVRDLLSEGAEDKLMALFAEQKTAPAGEQSRIHSEILAIERQISGANRFLDAFGLGGMFDQSMRQGYIRLLKNFGMETLHNDSPDPAKFWEGQIWDEKTGKPIPIHPSLVRTVEEAQALTRGIPSRISANDNYTLALIQQEETSNTPDAIKRRLMWALSTGRKNWVLPGGAFKGKVRDLFESENQVVEDLKGFIADKDPNGTVYGLTMMTTPNGKRGFLGSPSKEQAKKLMAFLSQASEEASPGRGQDMGTQYQALLKAQRLGDYAMNTETLGVIAQFLDGIAKSDIFDNDNIANGSAGTLPVYTFEYQGVTKQVTPGTTESVSAKGQAPRLRRMSPFSVVVEESSLDREGNAYQETDAQGNKTGKKVGSRSNMYFWAIDVDAFDQRLRAGWYGKLIDSEGQYYKWTHAHMQNMFGGDYNRYTEAMNIVLKNFAQGGPQDGRRKGGAKFPPKRTWQALLDMNGGDQRGAMRMADILLRVIGFPDVELNEYARLSEKANHPFTPGEWSMSPAEKARMAELEKKFGDGAVNERDMFFARLNAKHPNEVGAGPIWDSRMIFTKIRADRIVGGVERMVNKDGKNSTMNFTPWSYHWGQANYNNAASWTVFTPKDIATVESTYNMQGLRILSGTKHYSGYTAWLVQDDKPANYAGSQKWIVFDPRRGRVPGEFKFAKDAFEGAQTHSKNTSGIPEIGNKFEIDMQDNNFVPVGTDFILGRRTEFVSGDGAWNVRWNRTSGKWDLYEGSKGLLIRSGMNLNDPAKKGGMNATELKAYIQDAIDKDSVSVALTNELHRDLGEKGIMEWRRVKNADGTKTRVRFAENNPAYWAFKKHLLNITDASYANDVTMAMRKDLGHDVVNTDVSATIKWIQQYRQKGDLFFLNRNLIEPVRATVKTELAAERAASERKRSIPNKKPDPLPDRKTFSGTNAEWEAMQREFDRMTVEYSEAEAFELSSEQMALEQSGKVEALQRFMKWADNLGEEQKRFAEQQSKPPVVVDKTIEGRFMANLLGQIRSSVAQAGVSVENTAFLNDFGYLIHSVSYKRIPDLAGVRVTGRSLTEIMTGNKFENQFFVFNPAGAMVGKAKTLQEASDIANDNKTAPERAKLVLDKIREEEAKQQAKDKEDVNRLRHNKPDGTPSRSKILGGDSTSRYRR